MLPTPVAFMLLFACHAVAAPLVLVTGATGRTGSLLYNSLKEQGINVRGFVRNATKARELLHCVKCDESEGIFAGDITKKETLAPAMEGISSLAITTSAIPVCEKGKNFSSCGYPRGGYPIDVDWHGGMAQIEAFGLAKRSGAGLIVLCSSMGTTNPTSFLEKLGNGHIGAYKLNEEAFLMSSGLPFTIVKPCGLTNNPAGEKKLLVGHDDNLQLKPPTISRADVARVMQAALVKPDDAMGLRFDLCSSTGTPTTDVSDVFKAARYPWEHVPAASELSI